MEAVAALAVRYLNVNPLNSRPPPAPILNRVAPPDVPFLKPELKPRNEQDNRSDPAQTDNEEVTQIADPARILQARLRGVVDAQQVKVPIHRLEGPEGRKWALTYLRQELAQICDARVCLGGKLTNFSGLMPG
jgi:hypothetical protein